jgi:hypothetical protein
MLKSRFPTRVVGCLFRREVRSIEYNEWSDPMINQKLHLAKEINDVFRRLFALSKGAGASHAATVEPNKAIDSGAFAGEGGKSGRADGISDSRK